MSEVNTAMRAGAEKWQPTLADRRERGHRIDAMVSGLLLCSFFLPFLLSAPACLIAKEFILPSSNTSLMAVVGTAFGVIAAVTLIADAIILGCNRDLFIPFSKNKDTN